MQITIKVNISNRLRHYVFVKTGYMADGVWEIAIDTGCFDTQERWHMLTMPKWNGKNRFSPFDPKENEVGIVSGTTLYVGKYVIDLSEDDPHIWAKAYEIDLDPEDELEHVVVNAYLAEAGVDDRDHTVTVVDAARALVRLDAQFQAEAFRQFRQAMIAYIRDIVAHDRVENVLLAKFLQEVIRQYD